MVPPGGFGLALGRFYHSEFYESSVRMVPVSCDSDLVR